MLYNQSVAWNMENIMSGQLLILSEILVFSL